MGEKKFPRNECQKNGEDANKKMVRKKFLIRCGLLMLLTASVYEVNSVIQENKNNTLEYDSEDNENFIIDGSVKYETFKDYKFITITDEMDNKHYFIGKYNSLTGIVYDVETDMKFKTSGFDDAKYLIEVNDLNEYLIMNDQLKNAYDKEDIELLKESIIDYKVKRLNK